MSALDVLTHVSRFSLVAVALVALVDWLRHRDRSRLIVFLTLASLGLPAATAWLPEPFRTQRWFSLSVAGVLLLQPLFTLGLVGLFRPVSRAAFWLAASAAVASEAVIFFDTPPIATPLVLMIIAYFVVVSGYAAWAMLLALARSSGAFRMRLAFAAAGSSMLGVIFIVAGLAIAIPGLTRWSSAFLPAAVGICFFLGFTPPPWMRRTWQLPELQRFLGILGELKPADRPRQAGEELCKATTRVTGAIASAIFVWDEQSKVLRVEASDLPSLVGRIVRPDEGTVGKVWREKAPLFAGAPADLSPIGRELRAHSKLAVPITGAERAWGVLVSYRAIGVLFPQDLLELMGLLAAQYAIILENAELIREQERLVNDLRSANEEMEAFTYSISHDLRRPLRGIDGFSDALLEDYGGKLDDQGVHYLNRVREAAQAMGRQIDELLHLSRVTREELRVQPLDLSSMVAGMMKDLSDREPQRQVEVKIAEGLTAYGDPNLVPLVLQNLLENAWKFTANRPEARIELGVQHVNGGTPAYYVRDNGAGFREESADRLFRPFQRLHSQKDFPGTGIGLATVWWIVRRHGGRVWAEGAVDRGATFYFTLPWKGQSVGRGIDLAGGRLAG